MILRVVRRSLPLMLFDRLSVVRNVYTSWRVLSNHSAMDSAALTRTRCEVKVGSICGSNSVRPAFHPVSIEIKAAPDTNLKMFKKVVELVHEEVDCSKFFGDVFRLRGLADIDLVVKDDGYVEASVEFFEGGRSYGRDRDGHVARRGVERLGPVPCLLRFATDMNLKSISD